MGDFSLSKLAEQVVKVAPALDVFVPLAIAVGSILTGLPRVELQKAVGDPARLWDEKQAEGVAIGDLVTVTPEFDHFVPSTDFLARVVAGVLTPEHLLLGVVSLVCLATGVLWVQAIVKRRPTTRELTGVTYVLLVGFASFLVSVALLYPRFAAPSRLEGLSLRLADPASFDPSREGAHHQALFEAIHGGTEEKFVAGRLGKVRRRPEAGDFRYFHSYFEDLSAYTVCGLFVLSGLTLAFRTMLSQLREGAKWKFPVLFFLLSLTLIAHAFQWAWLVRAYGRLPATAGLLSHYVARYEAETDEFGHWPFLGPHPVWDGSEIVVKNFWPLSHPRGPRATEVFVIAVKVETAGAATTGPTYEWHSAEVNLAEHVDALGRPRIARQTIEHLFPDAEVGVIQAIAVHDGHAWSNGELSWN